MFEMFENIAIGIIAYNPPETLWKYVAFLTNLKLKVWIIDNSEFEHNFSDIEFYNHNANIGGMAKALNILCKHAQEQNLEWLLTLDQDSEFKTEQDLLNLLKCSNTTESDVAIYAPKMPQILKAERVSYVMTSGTLLRMQAQKECGFYREDFFIDALDTEYCFRLQSRGWKIKTIENSVLNHKQGAMKHKHIPIINKHFYLFEYNPKRLYHITKNHLITIKLYKEQFPADCRELKRFLLNNFIKILFYENNKCKKIKAIVRGFLRSRK